MVRQFVKYNPAFLDREKLVGNFVVRQTDLQMIVRIVRDNAEASNQHILVIGPRGSGKTTLVRRVSAEIERDETLNKSWYPLIFAEESYNALSAADFWLESLFHLAEQTGESRWMESYHELRRDPDEKRLAQRALGQLLDFADSISKRILLVVENLDMLLSEFSDESEAWSLRHTLMNEPRLMLLASATGRFEEIDHPARPMFEMFRIHDLKPLDDDACNALWSLVTGDPLPGEQIRPIRILTGGNARLISIIAKSGANRSFSDLLVDLIDEHTDYFKSHLDNMAPKERKVYLALAELWSVATAKEIARTARIDVNSTSALLNRLVSRGRVVVEGKGKKDRRYRISEGIYNLYYHMRRRGGPSARVKAAVQVMVSLYQPAVAAKHVADEIGSLDPVQCRDHFMAIEEIFRSASSVDRLAVSRLLPSSRYDSPYIADQLGEQMITYRDMSADGYDEELVLLRGKIAHLKKLFHNTLDLMATQQGPQVDEIVVEAYNQFKELSYTHGLVLLLAWVDRPELFNDSLFPIIMILIEQAASGKALAVLQILDGSQAEQYVEPLVVGLKLYLGWEVHPAPEILEVAKDVVKRIETKQRAIKALEGLKLLAD